MKESLRVSGANLVTLDRDGDDASTRAVRRVGRRQWKREAGYHQQARVENAFFRYKTIFGGALRARHPKGQAVETVVACNILNRMTELGKPGSYAISR